MAGASVTSAQDNFDLRRATVATSQDTHAAPGVQHDPSEWVTDCRYAKANKYLELALAAGADAIISGDADPLDEVLNRPRFATAIPVERVGRGS